MANSNRVTYGDREGVIVRSVKTTDGVELTVRVPDDQDVLASLDADDDSVVAPGHTALNDGHGNITRDDPRYNVSVEEAVEKSEEIRTRGDRRVADAVAGEPAVLDGEPVSGASGTSVQDEADKGAARAKREEGDADRGEKLLAGDKSTAGTKAPAKATGNKAAGSK